MALGFLWELELGFPFVKLHDQLPREAPPEEAVDISLKYTLSFLGATIEEHSLKVEPSNEQLKSASISRKIVNAR